MTEAEHKPSKAAVEKKKTQGNFMNGLFLNFAACEGKERKMYTQVRCFAYATTQYNPKFD